MLEEGFLRSTRLATTTNGLREVGLVAAIIWCGGFILIHTVESPLPYWLDLILVVLAGLLSAWLVLRYLAVKGPAARKAKAEAEYRANIEQETERQLAEMRAKRDGERNSA